MPRHRVLIVEDEPDIAHLIKRTIERGGDTEAAIVATGGEALKAVGAKIPDLIILDLNLPGIDGIEVCRTIRSYGETRRVPIIILTARTTEDDRVRGLDIGADDYITKPFSPRELTARVRAVLRRVGDHPSGDKYVSPRLMADFEAVSVAVDGDAVKLTRREFELLRYLIHNRNRVVSRERLLERVWGYDRLVETRSVDVHVGRLRAKLGGVGNQIETVIGLGYRFVG